MDCILSHLPPPNAFKICTLIYLPIKDRIFYIRDRPKNVKSYFLYPKNRQIFGDPWKKILPEILHTCTYLYVPNWCTIDIFI